MLKTTNLLFAAAIPVIYTAFRYFHDDNFKNNVDQNLSKGCSFIREKTSGLIGDVKTQSSSISEQAAFTRNFIKDKYFNLKLDKSQLNDIANLYESSMRDLQEEVEKVLTTEQKMILGESKRDD